MHKVLHPFLEIKKYSGLLQEIISFVKEKQTSTK